jgi:hypothetical protein
MEGVPIANFRVKVITGDSDYYLEQDINTWLANNTNTPIKIIDIKYTNVREHSIGFYTAYIHYLEC